MVAEAVEGICETSAEGWWLELARWSRGGPSETFRRVLSEGVEGPVGPPWRVVAELAGVVPRGLWRPLRRVLSERIEVVCGGSVQGGGGGC